MESRRHSSIRRDLRAPVVEHRHAARGHGRAERYDVAVAPHLGADRFAGIHRRREAAFHAFEARRVVAAAGLEQRVRGDAERARGRAGSAF